MKSKKVTHALIAANDRRALNARRLSMAFARDEVPDWPKVHLLRVHGISHPISPMTRDEVAARKFEVRTTVTDHFAWLRTRLALERTLMSWVGTATGLIAFGFTIVQVIEWLQTQHPEKPVLAPNMAHYLGLALIGAGVVGLAIGIAQYRRLVGYMWSSVFEVIAGISEKPLWTPLVSLAILVEFAGVVAFVTVFFRLS
jgi:putative membrane protein